MNGIWFQCKSAKSYQWFLCWAKKHNTCSVADLGFPRGGRLQLSGGVEEEGGQHTLLSNFHENCMKSKEFGCPGEGHEIQRNCKH